MRVGAICVIAAALTAGLFTGCQSQVVPSPASPAPSRVVETSPSAAPVAPTPEPTEAVGPLVEGVPASLDGRPVFHADELRAQILDRTDATSFYAGGWFRDVNRAGGFCALYSPPPLFDVCHYGFSLWDGRTGYWDVTLSRGRPPHTVIDAALPFAADRAVVLQIHTNDPTCSPDVLGYPTCVHIPVVENVAWLGPVEAEPPTPTSRPAAPTDGLSRADAVAFARKRVASSSDVICARVLIWSEIAGSLHPIKMGYNDPWVWYVGFRNGPMDYVEVVLNYRTGGFLFSSSGHRPGAGPENC